MRCTVLLGVTLNDEKLTLLIVFKDSQREELPGRSMKCQHP